MSLDPAEYACPSRSTHYRESHDGANGKTIRIYECMFFELPCSDDGAINLPGCVQSCRICLKTFPPQPTKREAKE